MLEYFTPDSRKPDGTIDMFSGPDEHNRKSLYLTNVHGDKLLKLAIKDEPRSGRDQSHAQIKIISTAIKWAHVWADKPTDPKKVKLPEQVEMTYHGAHVREMKPKVHLKAQSGYRTLIDDSLDLPSTTNIPVPLFALESSYNNERRLGNPVTKKGHVVCTDNPCSVRADFYLASSEVNIYSYMSSIHFFSFLFTQDYLASAKGHPLVGGQIIAPVKIFRMGSYLLFVRRSISAYRGRPQLSFYSNKNYYPKMMGRSVAWKDENGRVQLSTMAAEEQRLRLGRE
ncbi:hypothetical protein [Aliidiomarina celeris]|uniref:hypothetical protein n=1 Tax=Aliidiomarina celeris TaxID=2249428 RepID=UPI000DEA0674|nr:hypothetical protein [Aliidiomarina celeris]